MATNEGLPQNDGPAEELNDPEASPHDTGVRLELGRIPGQTSSQARRFDLANGGFGSPSVGAVEAPDAVDGSNPVHPQQPGHQE